MTILIILAVIKALALFYVISVYLKESKSHKEQLSELENRLQTASQAVGELNGKNHELIEHLQTKTLELDNAYDIVDEERSKYKKVLSQKKSSETRLGLVAEQIVPFLENCPYNPENMQFMGKPIDFVVFDFDAGEIVFLEVKSGNAKESTRQKTIKNIIKEGNVFYEKMRINEHGVKHIREKNKS